MYAFAFCLYQCITLFHKIYSKWSLFGQCHLSIFFCWVTFINNYFHCLRTALYNFLCMIKWKRMKKLKWLLPSNRILLLMWYDKLLSTIQTQIDWSLCRLSMGNDFNWTNCVWLVIKFTNVKMFWTIITNQHCWRWEIAIAKHNMAMTLF